MQILLYIYMSFYMMTTGMETMQLACIDNRSSLECSALLCVLLLSENYIISETVHWCTSTCTACVHVCHNIVINLQQQRGRRESLWTSVYSNRLKSSLIHKYRHSALSTSESRTWNSGQPSTPTLQLICKTDHFSP